MSRPRGVRRVEKKKKTRQSPRTQRRRRVIDSDDRTTPKCPSVVTGMNVDGGECIYDYTRVYYIVYTLLLAYTSPAVPRDFEGVDTIGRGRRSTRTSDRLFGSKR